MVTLLGVIWGPAGTCPQQHGEVMPGGNKHFMVFLTASVTLFLWGKVSSGPRQRGRAKELGVVPKLLGADNVPVACPGVINCPGRSFGAKKQGKCCSGDSSGLGGDLLSHERGRKR